MGYTPELTAAVWMGYADPLPDGTVPTMDADSAVAQSRRAERRDGRQPAGRDLAQVHAGRHRGRRRDGASSEPDHLPRARCSTSELRAHHDDRGDLVDELHDARRAPPPPRWRTRPRRPAAPPAPRPPPRSRRPPRTATRPTDGRARRAPGSDESRAGSWCGTGSTSARPRRAPRPSPPGPTPRGSGRCGGGPPPRRPRHRSCRSARRRPSARRLPTAGVVPSRGAAGVR